MKKLTGIELAIVLATTAHAGQLDKGGQPYILHPLRVMLAMCEEDERIVAVLHDTIEDTELMLADLVEQFSRKVVDAVDALTRRESETYFEYIQRLVENETACKVKLADLADNMSQDRSSYLSEDERTGLNKRYTKALQIVTEALGNHKKAAAQQAAAF